MKPWCNRIFVFKDLVLKQNKIHSKRLCTDGSKTLLLDKWLEQPILVVAEEDYIDLIGPPDSESNLRPIIRKELAKETYIQQRLRLMQDSTQVWNQQFWSNHNRNFVKEREEFMAARNKEAHQCTAEEISHFYKNFLDKNWKNHLNYNIEWYSKNVVILYFAFAVMLEKYYSKLV